MKKMEKREKRRKKRKKWNSRKSVRWSAVPVLCPIKLCLKLEGRQGSGLEGENSPFVWKHRSSTPLGPLPCSPHNLNHNLLRQSTGTADHLTLLRLLWQCHAMNWIIKVGRCIHKSSDAFKQIYTDSWPNWEVGGLSMFLFMLLYMRWYRWASLERMPRDLAKLCADVKLPFCQYTTYY